jgi:hypothetical protein
MGWKERARKFAEKHGGEVVAGASALSVKEIVDKISSVPEALWDLINPSDFTEKEKQEVERLLSRYGLKVSLVDLENEDQVFVKLNKFSDNLSKNEKEEFLSELKGILDKY